MLYNIVIVLILLICIALAGIILIQNSKGGGLAANFSAPNQIMGVRKTTDFLEKATWTLAVLLIVLSIVATALVRSQRPSNSTELSTEVTVDNGNYTQLPSNTVDAGAAATEATGQSETSAD